MQTPESAEGVPLKIGLRLENPSFTELSARVRFQEQGSAVKRRSNGSWLRLSGRGNFLRPSHFRSGEERVLNVTAQVDGSTDGNNKYTDSLRLIGLPRMKKGVVADGDLSDWQGHIGGVKSRMLIFMLFRAH